MADHKKVVAISCLAASAIIVVAVLGLVALIVTWQLFFAPSRSEVPPRPAPTPNPVPEASLTKSRYIENLGLKLGYPYKSSFEPGADGFKVWATVENYNSCTVSDVELTATGIKDGKEIIDSEILAPQRDLVGNGQWIVVFSKFTNYVPGDLLDKSSGRQKPIARFTNMTVEISRIRLADASCQY